MKKEVHVTETMPAGAKRGGPLALDKTGGVVEGMKPRMELHECGNWTPVGGKDCPHCGQAMQDKGQ